jgi:hypothetical protein
MADLALSNPSDSTERIDARRTTRVFQAVPLSVSGMNELGNPFLEMTSAVAFNCHGCLYRSRYHNRPGSWVTLHMASSTTAKAQPVRAQIRFVRLPASPKELYQVGVELENPANVWGIQSPPEDWVSFAGTIADAPATEKSSGLRVVSENPAPVRDRSENGKSATTAPSAAPEIAGMPPAGKPVRVVVSSEQLLQRLEGKLQQAADKAVDSAMSVRFSAVVNQAAKAIDEFSQSSVRKVQKQYEQYREQMMSSAREQFLSRVQADLASAEERLERRVETLLGRAEEAARRVEGSIAGVEPAVKRVEASAAAMEPAAAEAESSLQKAALRAQYEFAARAGEIASRTEAQLSDQTARLAEQQIARLGEQAQVTVDAAAKQLQAKGDETRSQVIGDAGTVLAELHVAARAEIERAVGESRQNVESSLASFCEDTTTGWEARMRACQDELAMTSAREVEEFRARLHAILNSSMIAATSAVSEHAKALLDVLAKDAGQLAPEAEREAS